ncbi:MAG: PglZ domain-containing protein [Thermomicrobiales bacterium]
MLDQRDIFSQRVQPLTGRGKTAYVIVDSLRFEMARELANTAHAAWQAKLTPAAATIPTLTAICKAALVAGANEPLALELKGTQLIPTLSGIEIQNPAARRKRMEQALDHSVVTVGLRDLTPMTAKTRADLAKASFVLITSDEIDQSGENVDHATQAINSVLDDLRRAFGTLSRVGHDKKSRETPIEQIVVVADHGHIFAGDLTEGEKIEPPGPGAHRRIWIGHGGSASNAFLRFQARDIRLGGDLEFATPWNLSAFRTSGGTAYFHGGLSPQELLVPVLTLTRVTTSATNAESAVAWQVSTPKNQITSRSVRVIVSGSAMEILPVPERVRIAVEVRRGNTVLSKMRSASVPLDIESQVVEMERDPDDHRQLVPAQIGILLFGDHIENGQVSLHVIDVDSGIELIAATNISLTVMG